jgi:exodeoxyribonuclease III
MKWNMISWNVNGVRSLIKKNYQDLTNLINNNNPHILCLSETKLSCPLNDVIEEFKKLGFKYSFWSPCLVKKGYSGTGIMTKRKPLSVIYGINLREDENIDDEGRVLTVEYKNFYVVNVYTPNSGQELKRLEYRVNTWDPYFREYILMLQKKKKVIVCGDLNVAHYEIDIANPKGNTRSAGFTKEERESFDKLLNQTKMIDSFRNLNPNLVKYSYWTYMFSARKKNKGWRIDYFLVDKRLKDRIKKADILAEYYGSDHAPVLLEISSKKD